MFGLNKQHTRRLLTFKGADMWTVLPSNRTTLAVSLIPFFMLSKANCGKAVVQFSVLMWDLCGSSPLTLGINANNITLEMLEILYYVCIKFHLSLILVICDSTSCYNFGINHSISYAGKTVSYDTEATNSHAPFRNTCWNEHLYHVWTVYY